MIFDNEDVVLQVVINTEGQYSIWPIKKRVPEGWKSVEFKGTKSECLTFIDARWTDMRPRGLKELGVQGLMESP